MHMFTHTHTQLHNLFSEYIQTCFYLWNLNTVASTQQNTLSDFGHHSHSVNGSHNYSQTILIKSGMTMF